MTWTPSHCDPTQPSYIGQLRPAPYPGYGGWYDPGSPRRGGIIYFPGLATGSWNRKKIADASGTPAVRTTLQGDLDTGFFPDYTGSLLANLINDGWEVFRAPYPEVGTNVLTSAGVPSIPAMGLQLDLTNDPNHGANYTAAFQRSLDHIVEGIRYERGASFPLVIFGASHGGWAALQAAAYLGGRLAGVIACIPATRWGVANRVFSAPANFNNIDVSGLNLDATALNGIPASLPVLISYGTTDNVVGWSQTTVAGASIGVDVSTFAGSGTLTVTDASKLSQAAGNGAPIGSGVIVPTSNGFATITYQSVSGNVLIGCDTTLGSGTIVSGAVIQSTADAMITAAQAAGKSVTRNATTSGHAISYLAAGSYFPLTGPTALSSLGTLTCASNLEGDNFVSGSTKIRDTGGVWHTVNFTGTSTTTVNGATVLTLTGCTYSGSTSATVALGSPIVASGTTQSVLWWLTQNIDTNCPAVF